MTTGSLPTGPQSLMSEDRASHFLALQGQCHGGQRLNTFDLMWGYGRRVQGEVRGGAFITHSLGRPTWSLLSLFSLHSGSSCTPNKVLTILHALSYCTATTKLEPWAPLCQYLGVYYWTTKMSLCCSFICLAMRWCQGWKASRREAPLFHMQWEYKLAQAGDRNDAIARRLRICVLLDFTA